MRNLTISFMILSGLFGTLIGLLGLIVGVVAYVDETWAWMVAATSFIYALHPALIYWLFKKTYETLALILSALFMLSSIVLSLLA